MTSYDNVTQTQTCIRAAGCYIYIAAREDYYTCRMMFCKYRLVFWIYPIRISVESLSIQTGFVVLSLQINARIVISQARTRGEIMRVANGAAVPSDRVQEAKL